MDDKQLVTQVHTLIHSLRLIPNYKASEAEKKLSQYVIERFKTECDECKSVGETIKNQKPAAKGFLSKIGEAINNDD